MLKLAAVTLTIFLLFVHVTTAQTADDSTKALPPADSLRIVRLPGISVMAERIPYNLSLIPSAASIQILNSTTATQGKTVGSLIGEAPGFRSYNQGNPMGQPVIEPSGFYGAGQTQYALITYDRIPLNQFASGLTDLSGIDPGEIGRIEYVRGPASASFGDFGFGGHIAISSANRLGGRGAQIVTQLGSSHTGSAALRTWTSWQGVDFAMSTAAHSSEGWREHSRSTSGRLLLQAGQHRSSGEEWSALVVIHELHELLPGALVRTASQADPSQQATDFFGNALPDERRSLAVTAGMSSRILLGSGLQLLPALYANMSDQDNVVSVTSSLRHEPVLRSAGGDVSVLTSGKLYGRELVACAGISGEIGHLATRYAPFENDRQEILKGNGDRTVFGLYTQAAYHLLDRLTWSGGVRYDYFDTQFRRQDEDGDKKQNAHALSPRMGLSADLGHHVSAYVAVSGAFKAPTLIHLYDSPPVAYPTEGGGTDYLLISNHDLTPMRGACIMAGIRRLADSLGGCSVDIYDYEIRDEIDFDAARLQYVNSGRSRITGMDIGGTIRPHSGVRVFGTVTLVSTKFRSGENTGKQANGVPRLTGMLSSSVTALPRFEIVLSVMGRAGQHLDQANRYRLGDFVRTDIACHYTRRQASVTIGVRNLFDRRYDVDGYVGLMGEERVFPAAVRQAVIGMSISL